MSLSAHSDHSVDCAICCNCVIRTKWENKNRRTDQLHICTASSCLVVMELLCMTLSWILLAKLFHCLIWTGYGPAGYALFVLVYAGLEVCSQVSNLGSFSLKCCRSL